ncbi:hypothetical protein ABS198_22410, partial [Acinetobacter baumannii]|uniref:hypothetical protein n=1 Tax=Acinetobacter baumannii TaxID=470 RepID=UPI003333A52E
ALALGTFIACRLILRVSRGVLTTAATGSGGGAGSDAGRRILPGDADGESGSSMASFGQKMNARTLMPIRKQRD